MGKNHLGKRRNYSLLLFLQCFQKSYTADALKPGLVWERVKMTFFSPLLNVFYLAKDKLRGHPGDSVVSMSDS